MGRDLVRERTIEVLTVARWKGGGGHKIVMAPERIQVARQFLASGIRARGHCARDWRVDRYAISVRSGLRAGKPLAYRQART